MLFSTATTNSIGVAMIRSPFRRVIAVAAGLGIVSSLLYLPTSSAAAGTDTLYANETLANEQAIRSSNGYTFVMQGDGNAVIYKPTAGGRTAIWSTNTPGRSNSYLAMQSDGNLVLYSNGVAYWSTGMKGAGSYLVMQTDGNLVMYRPSGNSRVAVWSSDSAQAVPPPTTAPAPTYSDTLASGATLPAGGQLRSSNGYRLVMQTDGNLVVYSPSGTVVKATNKYGAGAYLVMQPDGNGVVYQNQAGADRKVIWAANKYGAGAYLVMQTDGNAVAYQSTGLGTRRAIWSSNDSFTKVIPSTTKARLVAPKKRSVCATRDPDCLGAFPSVAAGSQLAPLSVPPGKLPLFWYASEDFYKDCHVVTPWPDDAPDDEMCVVDMQFKWVDRSEVFKDDGTTPKSSAAYTNYLRMNHLACDSNDGWWRQQIDSRAAAYCLKVQLAWSFNSTPTPAWVKTATGWLTGVAFGGACLLVASPSGPAAFGVSLACGVAGGAIGRGVTSVLCGGSVGEVFSKAFDPWSVVLDSVVTTYLARNASKVLDFAVPAIEGVSAIRGGCP